MGGALCKWFAGDRMLFYHGAHGLGGGGHQLLYQVGRKSGVVQSPGSASDARPVMFCIAARRLWRYTWWWDAASGHSGLKEKAAGKCHSSV